MNTQLERFDCVTIHQTRLGNFINRATGSVYVFWKKSHKTKTISLIA